MVEEFRGVAVNYRFPCCPFLSKQAHGWPDEEKVLDQRRCGGGGPGGPPHRPRRERDREGDCEQAKSYWAAAKIYYASGEYPPGFTVD